MDLNNLVTYFEQDWAQLTAGLVLLLFIALLFYFIANTVLRIIIFKFLGGQHSKDSSLSFVFIKRLAQIAPALIISVGISKVPHLHPDAVAVIANVANAFIVLAVALTLAGTLNLINQIYEKRPDAKNKPIKGYIEVVKIVIYFLATILIVAALFDKSPLILLSGLGALAAVLMLVFQDTILSLVASIQISSNDIIRVGDWVEMPQLNADGDVIDIALHTVKVQNWDKTITTVPTRRFISDPFKNWRGMQESGGRRIKRNLMLDQQSVRFLTLEDIERLKGIKILREYLDSKADEIAEWNAQVETSDKAFYQRSLTNIGTFRAYIVAHLKHHPRIHKGYTSMVRQLQPTAEGMPLELYCFTDTVAWVEYEDIQSDIFDHLLAIAPEFGIKVFQNPSGSDFAKLTAK